MTVDQIMDEIISLPADERAQVLNRLQRLNAEADLAQPDKLDPSSSGRWFFEVNYNEEVKIHAEYKSDSLSEFLRGLMLYVGLNDNDPNFQLTDQYQRLDNVGQYIVLNGTSVVLNPGTSYELKRFLPTIKSTGIFDDKEGLEGIALNEWLDKATNDAGEYIRHHLAEKLYKATSQLFYEAVLYAHDDPITVEKRKRIERMMPVLAARGRGGDTRSEHSWTDEDRMRLALATEVRHSLWAYITNYFERNDYDQGCNRAVKEQERFRELSKDCREVPDDLVAMVFKRQYKSGPAYRPLAFALEHARRELGISYPYSYDALKKAYDKGRKLLRTETNQKPH